MAKRRRKNRSFSGAEMPLWQAGAAALVMFGAPLAFLVYLTRDRK